MAHLTRWFVLLGVLVALPAATLLGAGVGEVLRTPEAGMQPLLAHEALVIGLLVGATFLFSTAAGIRDSRRWALTLGLAEAGVIILAGICTVVAGGPVMRALGGAPQLTLGTLPLGLGATVLGARLFAELWRVSDIALPIARKDLQAVGALAGVTAVALLGHVLAAGVAS
jgi:hypothetical protein